MKRRNSGTTLNQTHCKLESLSLKLSGWLRGLKLWRGPRFNFGHQQLRWYVVTRSGRWFPLGIQVSAHSKTRQTPRSVQLRDVFDKLLKLVKQCLNPPHKNGKLYLITTFHYMNLSSKLGTL